MMNGKCLLLVVCLVYICGTDAYAPFRVIDCTDSYADRLVTVSDALAEHPIRIPGHVTATGRVDIHRNVTGDVRLDVTVKKFMMWDYFTLPCISRVGSCSYDLCDLLDWFDFRGGCPWQLIASDNFPCQCPFGADTHVLRPFPFYIPAVHGVWAWIAFGDFRVNGRLVNATTGEEIACSTVEFSVESSLEPDYSWNMWDW